MDKTETRISADEREIAKLASKFVSLDPDAASLVEHAVVSPIATEGDFVNISGRSACGKTSLVADIALTWAHPERRQLALGGLFKVSRTYREAGNVAIIDGENTPIRWQSILRRLIVAEGLDSNAVRGRVIYLTPASAGLHDARLWQKRSVMLAEALARNGANLVIMDSLARIWGPEDINQTNWVQQGLTPFRDACKRLGITVLAVSHTRRNSGGDDGELSGPIGSSMQEGQVDCQLIMTKDSDGRGCSLRMVKCRRAYWIRSGSKIALAFTPRLGYAPQDNWSTIWPHEPPEDPQIPEVTPGIRSQIVKLLEDADGLTLSSSALVAHLRCSSRTVTGHLSTLEAERRVERLGNGRSTTWRLIR
jgi:hypothetical protein